MPNWKVLGDKSDITQPHNFHKRESDDPYTYTQWPIWQSLHRAQAVQIVRGVLCSNGREKNKQLKEEKKSSNDECGNETSVTGQLESLKLFQLTVTSPWQSPGWPWICRKKSSFNEGLHFLLMCPQVASSPVPFPWWCVATVSPWQLKACWHEEEKQILTNLSHSLWSCCDKKTLFEIDF